MLLLLAATSFACVAPTHHDGDNIRCRNQPGSMRLHGIDAPEMPGACRPGRLCTPGDPYAARDHLRALTRGRDVVCEQVDTDHYGRRVVECRADGVNIACAMIADGYAVERYGAPDCSNIAPPASATPRVAAASPPVPQAPPSPPARATTPVARPVRAAEMPPQPAERHPVVLPLLAWLALVNLAGFALMASDKRRARRLARRVPESTLLLVAALGGSGGALAAQQLLRHKTRKQPFARRLLAILLVQLCAMGALLFMSR